MPRAKSAVVEFVESVEVKSFPWRIPSHEGWEEMSLDSANDLVQRLIVCYQEGAKVISQRVYNEQRESGSYKCMVCGKKKPMAVDNRPNYVWRDDRQDPISKLWTPRIICTQECYFRGSNSGKLTNRGVPAFKMESGPKPKDGKQE